jgi:hypothetical protein
MHSPYSRQPPQGGGNTSKPPGARAVEGGGATGPEGAGGLAGRAPPGRAQKNDRSVKGHRVAGPRGGGECGETQLTQEKKKEEEKK